jgi:hypothetical protein
MGGAKEQTFIHGFELVVYFLRIRFREGPGWDSSSDSSTALLPLRAPLSGETQRPNAFPVESQCVVINCSRHAKRDSLI